MTSKKADALPLVESFSFLLGIWRAFFNAALGNCGRGWSRFFWITFLPKFTSTSLLLLQQQRFPQNPLVSWKLLNFLQCSSSQSKLQWCQVLVLNHPARACQEDSWFKSVNALGEWLLALKLPCRSKSNQGRRMYMTLSRFAGTKSVSPLCNPYLSCEAPTQASWRCWAASHLQHFCLMEGVILILSILPKFLMGSFWSFGEYVQKTRRDSGTICLPSAGIMCTDQENQSQHR